MINLWHFWKPDVGLPYAFKSRPVNGKGDGDDLFLTDLGNGYGDGYMLGAGDGDGKGNGRRHSDGDGNGFGPVNGNIKP